MGVEWQLSTDKYIYQYIYRKIIIQAVPMHGLWAVQPPAPAQPTANSVAPPLLVVLVALTYGGSRPRAAHGRSE